MTDPRREGEKAEARAKQMLDQAFASEPGDPEFKLALTDLGAAVIGALVEASERFCDVANRGYGGRA